MSKKTCIKFKVMGGPIGFAHVIGDVAEYPTETAEGLIAKDQAVLATDAEKAAFAALVEAEAKAASESPKASIYSANERIAALEAQLAELLKAKK